MFQHADGRKALLDAFPDFLCRHADILGSKPDVLFYDLGDDLVVRVLEHHAGLSADLPQVRAVLGIHAVYPDCALCRE